MQNVSLSRIVCIFAQWFCGLANICSHIRFYRQCECGCVCMWFICLLNASTGLISILAYCGAFTHTHVLSHTRTHTVKLVIELISDNVFNSTLRVCVCLLKLVRPFGSLPHSQWGSQLTSSVDIFIKRLSWMFKAIMLLFIPWNENKSTSSA